MAAAVVCQVPGCREPVPDVPYHKVSSAADAGSSSRTRTQQPVFTVPRCPPPWPCAAEVQDMPRAPERAYCGDGRQKHEVRWAQPCVQQASGGQPCLLSQWCALQSLPAPFAARRFCSLCKRFHTLPEFDGDRCGAAPPLPLPFARVGACAAVLLSVTGPMSHPGFVAQEELPRLLRAAQQAAAAAQDLGAGSTGRGGCGWRPGPAGRGTAGGRRARAAPPAGVVACGQAGREHHAE